MRIELRCGCGAQFVGECERDGFAELGLFGTVDRWQALHEACRVERGKVRARIAGSDSVVARVREEKP